MCSLNICPSSLCMPTSIHQWTQCLHCKTRVYFCTRVARESNGASLTVVHERCVCVRVYARVYMNVYVCVQLHVYTILHVSSYEALRASVEVSAYSTRARTTHNTQHTTHNIQHTTHNTHNTQHTQHTQHSTHAHDPHSRRVHARAHTHTHLCKYYSD